MQSDYDHLILILLIIEDEYNLHKDHNTPVWDIFELKWSNELVKGMSKLTSVHYFDHNFCYKIDNHEILVGFETRL